VGAGLPLARRGLGHLLGTSCATEQSDRSSGRGANLGAQPWRVDDAKVKGPMVSHLREMRASLTRVASGTCKARRRREAPLLRAGAGPHTAMAGNYTPAGR
jgi:hypothetical protein